MRRLPALAAVLVLFAACSSEHSSSGTATDATDTTAVASSTSAPTTTSSIPATTPPATTEPSTTGPATTGPATTDGGPTTTAACVPDGDTLAQTSDDPLLMSSLVGVDIRTGVHPCFERIVIELGGSGGFPGWSVQYVNDPVRLGESNDFVSIAGTATLQVIMRMWMPTMEGDGYTGSIDFFPSNVDHILELRETENFEGMCIWSIGLDAKYPFTVDVLHSPERLVIDVQVPFGT